MDGEAAPSVDPTEPQAQEAKAPAVPMIRLRHVVWKTTGVLYFYNGSTKVHRGVVEIPANKIDWLRVAWTEGYRHLADNGEYVRSVEGLAHSVMTAASSEPEPAPEPQPEKPARRGRGRRTQEE